MNRYRTRKLLLFFLFLGMVFRCKVTAFAAFPSDMGEKKSVTCYSLTSENVEVYSDSAMKNNSGEVDGDGLILKARDINRSGMALYGAYSNENTGEKGEGWISISTFVKNPDYKSEYATIRADMYIYTNSSLATVRTTMKKYTGVIVVSEKGEALQVIYETKKAYAIGWMSVYDYSNTLKYDGRDKQLLRDSTYNLIPVSALDENSVVTSSAQSDTEESNTEEADAESNTDETDAEEADTGGNEVSARLKLTYDRKGNYYLENPDSGSYLAIRQTSYNEEDEKVITYDDPGLLGKIRSFFDSSYRKKQEVLKQKALDSEKAAEERQALLDAGTACEDSENHYFYSLEWIESLDEDDVYGDGTWHITREGNQFQFRYAGSELYLKIADADSWQIVNKDDPGDNTSYTVRAVSRVENPDDPFVITQYDAAWCGNAYGSDGCIGTAGCGLLATVNAVYSLSGQYMDVMELADFAVDQGYRIIGNGTDEGIFKAAASAYGEKYGFAWDGSSYNISALKKKLKKGDTAIAHVIGHYVAIVDYNEKTNEFLLLDSNHLPKRATSAFGDWVSQSRLEDGYLYGQNYYFFKLP